MPRVTKEYVGINRLTQVLELLKGVTDSLLENKADYEKLANVVIHGDYTSGSLASPQNIRVQSIIYFPDTSGGIFACSTVNINKGNIFSAFNGDLTRSCNIEAIGNNIVHVIGYIESLLQFNNIELGRAAEYGYSINPVQDGATVTATASYDIDDKIAVPLYYSPTQGYVEYYYKATTAINQGDTLTVGTNVMEWSIDDDIVARATSEAIKVGTDMGTAVGQGLYFIARNNTNTV